MKQIKKIRKLFIVFLLFQSYFAKCQISSDSLQVICIKEFQKDFPLKKYSCIQYRNSKEPIRAYTQEVFKDYFNNIKIFVASYNLNCGVHFSEVAHLYALDSRTGHPIHFKNDTEFANVINTSNIKIGCLDKSFLSIFLFYSESYGVTDPHVYPENLRLNSVIFKDAYILFAGGFNTFINGALTSRQTNYDINNSSENKIAMYVEYPKNGKDFVRRYLFYFDDNNNLIAASREACETIWSKGSYHRFSPLAK